MNLNQAIEKIIPPDAEAMRRAKDRLDGIAKPLNSLGKLERLIVKSAGIFRADRVEFDKKCVVVMCADNGVVEEGVTQTSSEVTAVVAENMIKGKATVSVMAKKQNAELFVIDIGINRELADGCGIINKKVKYGTENFVKKPAMTRADAVKAIETCI
jgi:nicotinate-nucleotide--dimethylbenzimidazole phosphoribosyltransferase